MIYTKILKIDTRGYKLNTWFTLLTAFRRYFFRRHGYFHNPTGVLIGLAIILISTDGFKPILIHKNREVNLNRYKFFDYIRNYIYPLTKDINFDRSTHIKFFYYIK